MSGANWLCIAATATVLFVTGLVNSAPAAELVAAPEHIDQVIVLAPSGEMMSPEEYVLYREDEQAYIADRIDSAFAAADEMADNPALVYALATTLLNRGQVLKSAGEAMLARAQEVLDSIEVQGDADE